MGELSASDARALFDRFVADGPARIAAFLDAIQDLGGPADALDRSLCSLEVVWPWFLASAPAPTDHSSNAAQWWEPFHPQWARALGPERSVLATGLSEYVFACVIERAPGATWIVGRRSSVRRHPVLQIPGRGEMDYAVPLGFAVRAVTGDRPEDREAASAAPARRDLARP